MSEEAGRTDPQVEKMEKTADELAHHGDKVGDEIDSTRADWESKKESAAVPGAVPDPEDEESGQDDEESGEDDGESGQDGDSSDET